MNPLSANDCFLIHDNARVHTSRAVQEFLDSRNVFVIKQPPYSPDTNVLDRFGFTIVEQKRTRLDFEDENEVKSFVTDALRTISLGRLVDEFNKLLNDLRNITDSQGSYLLIYTNVYIITFCFGLFILK